MQYYDSSCPLLCISNKVEQKNMSINTSIHTHMFVLLSLGGHLTSNLKPDCLGKL